MSSKHYGVYTGEEQTPEMMAAQERESKDKAIYTSGSMISSLQQHRLKKNSR
jgi:hypothetical protein